MQVSLIRCEIRMMTPEVGFEDDADVSVYTCRALMSQLGLDNGGVSIGFMDDGKSVV